MSGRIADCEIVESGGGGAEQEDTGYQPGGGDEGGSGHGGHQDERSDGQRPADGTVPGDVDQVVEPQQQRSDGDGDGRQDPVAMAGGDDDERKGEGGDQFDDRGHGDRAFDAFRFRAGGSAAGPGGDPDAIHQDRDDHHDGYACQGGGRVAADAEGAAHQPERREGQLDEAADAADPLRPGGSRGQLETGRRLRGGHVGLVWVRYQPTVSAMAVASGVPVVPKVDWNLVVSSTKGSSNS